MFDVVFLHFLDHGHVMRLGGDEGVNGDSVFH